MEPLLVGDVAENTYTVGYSKIPPLLAYVATLPCETLLSAINDKLQGSVAAYLSYCGVVNKQIKKGLFLSLSVNFFKLGEYLAKLQTRTWLSRALSSSFSAVVARSTKCTRHVHDSSNLFILL